MVRFAISYEGTWTPTRGLENAYYEADLEHIWPRGRDGKVNSSNSFVKDGPHAIIDWCTYLRTASEDVRDRLAKDIQATKYLKRKVETTTVTMSN
jgi:RIO-like serine/threonine protein kinase